MEAARVHQHREPPGQDPGPAAHGEPPRPAPAPPWERSDPTRACRGRRGSGWRTRRRARSARRWPPSGRGRCAACAMSPKRARPRPRRPSIAPIATAALIVRGAGGAGTPSGSPSRASASRRRSGARGWGRSAAPSPRASRCAGPALRPAARPAASEAHPGAAQITCMVEMGQNVWCGTADGRVVAIEPRSCVSVWEVSVSKFRVEAITTTPGHESDALVSARLQPRARRCD